MTPLLGHARTQRSFEALYHDHVSDVYRYALAVTGQTSDAEDVTQTTFMNAYRAYARGERPRKPQNWLLTIAHNVCRQRARFAYYRVREVELDENSVEALVPPDDVPTAADIRRALSHLPFQQRAVLIMRELEGRTHAEIAEIMDLTTHATEMLAFRARRALREHLAGSLTCTQAADALDRQMDGTLDPDSAGLLRAHLRECEDCERLARRIRAQRTGWGSLAVVSLPSSLCTYNHAAMVAGGSSVVGSAGIGAGVISKVAAVTIAAATVGGGAYLVKRDLPPLHLQPTDTPKAHVRHHHHGTAHASPVAAAASWHGTPTAAPSSTTVRHKTARPVKKGKKDTEVPIVTVPAVPTGAVTSPPQQPDDQTAPTDQSQQAGDQTAQSDGQTAPTEGQTAPPDSPTTTPPDDSGPTPSPPPQHPNNGVRSHGSPTPPAQPNGGGPQGQSNATPPPYNQ